MKQKKAQVTVFIILGIVLVIAASMVIFLRTSIETTETETGFRTITEKVPTEVLPVRTYVESAMADIILEGVDKLSKHGGYIYLDSFDSNPVNPTESDNVQYVEGYKLPYWYYMSSENDCSGGCTFDSEMPPLCKQGRDCVSSGDKSIEEELAHYINDELNARMNNFAPLVNQGFEITEEGTPKASVTIRENDIQVYVEYPLEVKKTTTTKVTQFQKIVQSPLTELYETAYEINNYEAEECFIEESVKEYTGSFMGLDENKLPPYSGTSRDMVVWPLFKVKDDLKGNIYTAMKKIGVFNTSGYGSPRVDPNDKYQLYLNDFYVFYAVREFRDVAVSFTYNPWWEPYVDIKPNEGGVLMPSNIEGGIAGLFQNLAGFNLYNFQYAYSFPVVVDIEKTDEKGDTHSFRFALESNTRGNDCFRPDDSTTIMESDQSLCDESFRDTPLQMKTVDVETGEPIFGVQVDFAMTGSDACFLGTTGADGEIDTLYTQGWGDSYGVILRKEGYLTKRISNRDFADNRITVLKPLKEKDVVFRLIPEKILPAPETVQSQAQVFNIISNNLQSPKTEDESFEAILLTFVRNHENYYDAPFEQSIYFSEGRTRPEKIKLLPGTYNISIQSYLYQNVTIPKELDRVCAKGGILGSCDKKPRSPLCHETDFDETTNPECYLKGYKCKASTLGNCDGANEEIPYAEVNMTTIPNGGVVLNNWKIGDYADLGAGDKVLFYLFRQNLPKRHNDVTTNLMKYEQLSEDFNFILEPQIK